MEWKHLPVMDREVIEYLGCRSGRIYVDGTVGGGGHAAEILKASSPSGRLIGIDRDDDALKAAKDFLKVFGDRATLVKANFRDLKTVLGGLGVREVDGVLLDLGVSSFQLESPERGFSFRFDSRLDMRMDKGQKTSAYELVNGLEETELTRIFREYGEEREARRVARAIVRERGKRPVETTGELVRIVLEAIPKRFQTRNIHPATKVFQALRIAVNDELGSLKQGLLAGMEALGKGGRMAVISFHSLEDRIVKNTFRAFSTGCVCPPKIPICICGRKPEAKILTKKALTPSEDEVEKNPRSRSAKLRAVEKL